MHENIWLSVICPTYNGEKFLRQALDSILIQKETNIDYIFIDDGSTDATLSILESYQDKISMKVILKKSGNWVTNTNFAITLTKGNYICFLHQDDLWLPQRLSTLKNITANHPNIDLILHATIFVDAKGRKLGVWKCPLPIYPKIVTSDQLTEKLLVQNFISIPGAIFKKNILEKIEKMDETLWYTADWDLWLSIAKKTNTIYLPQPLSAFRIHPNSQTARRSFDTNGFKNQLEKVFQKHFINLKLPKKKKKEIQKIAKFSIDLNVSLAKVFHKEKINYLNLIFSFIILYPNGWYSYFRDSRILERVTARLKINLK